MLVDITITNGVDALDALADAVELLADECEALERVANARHAE